MSPAQFAARRVVLLATVLVLTSGVTGAQELHPKVEKAMDLLQDGRQAKAEKAFNALLGKQPELRDQVALARAMHANRKDEAQAAHGFAAEAVESAGSDAMKLRARAELLVAEAALHPEGSTLFDEQIAALRTVLAGPDTVATDALRTRVCRARELLSEEHAASITQAAMPDSKVKYLPRVEPGSGDTAVKPEQIADREALPNEEQAKDMVGRMSAQIQATIDADGCFAKARVSGSTNETFKAVALEAVRGWVYRPPRFNGQPVALFYSSSLTFDAGNPGDLTY